jgi:hypothetical protein
LILCLPSARQNARKKIIFEFWKSFWWVENNYQVEHFGGGGGQNGVGMQNHILHMILIM